MSLSGHSGTLRSAAERITGIYIGVSREDFMAVYRIQWCWQGASAVPEDRYCNTLHFQKLVDVDFTAGAPSLGDSILGLLVSDPSGFYRVWAGDGLAGHAMNTGSSLKIYNLADPEPRTPSYQFTYPSAPPFSGGSGDPLPSEVAVCLSYQAVAAPGTNRARRRGRIYLGPLTTAAAVDGGNGAMVNPSLATAILSGWDNWVRDMEAIDCTPGIYSPTDELFLPVQNAWVDNAFDTQRRRGRAPTSREVWVHP